MSCFGGMTGVGSMIKISETSPCSCSNILID